VASNGRLRAIARILREPAAVVLGIVAVFWKLALTKQYTFIDNPDLVNMVAPRLQPTLDAIRHGSILLWNPYEWFGEPPIGQVQPGVTSPFTFLLAMAPLHNGQVQFFYVQIWFVLLHCIAGLFAWRLFRELGCSAGPAVVGGVLFASMGYYGNTGWPNSLQPAMMAPLVFLFLLRSLKGRAPLKNAAWAGVMLGISWLCGHHDPPVMMALAVAGIGLAAGFRRGNREAAALRMLVLFAAMGLVAAVQILPALEYGKLSTRWTDTGPKTWRDRVPFPEHETHSLQPPDLLHVLFPGGNGLYSDPFVGIVALSLAAVALRRGFRRQEVRLFTVLAVAALLYAMARSDALYGLLYALLPFIEKTREPIVALFLFDLAVAALAAIGAEIVFSSPDPDRERGTIRILVWFGVAVFGLVFVLASLKPAVNATTLVDGDQRPVMTALIGLLMAGVFQAWSRNSLPRRWALAMVGLLVIVEQSNEASWVWAQVNNKPAMALASNIPATEDLRDWLRAQPNPKRIQKSDKDVPFNFGDWYEMESGNAYGASILTESVALGGGWDERVARMYGLNYSLSRTQLRPGLEDVFTGASGIKVWRDPAAFPRAWTVHRTIVAADETKGALAVRIGPFDLRTTALTVGSQPALDSCDGTDRVTAIDEKPSSLQIAVEMSCRGLLVVSDSWYPGWRAQVDGKPAAIWKVNTAIRGVIVTAGRHNVTMQYRPFSVYFGFLCTLAGLAGAIVLQRRPEKDEADLLWTGL
jgi:Bacterial membrane protein YfhO